MFLSVLMVCFAVHLRKSATQATEVEADVVVLKDLNPVESLWDFICGLLKVLILKVLTLP